MNKYTVKLYEIHSTEITVEAYSEEEAREKIYLHGLLQTKPIIEYSTRYEYTTDSRFWPVWNHEKHNWDIIKELDI
jgi:hypothetical protein